MTTIWQDSVIATLAAVGLITLLWLLLTVLCSPWRRRADVAAAVLCPARGDAAGLEHTVRRLLRRLPETGICRILIVDCGLSKEGRQIACLLCREDESVSLCRREELPQMIDKE